VADSPLAQQVALMLNHGQYDVRTTAHRAEAEELKQSWRPHLLIVDTDLREGRASSLIGGVSGGRRLPTIVLTEHGDLKNKLAAFERGADDFLSLPLVPEELVARSLALMRRTYGGPAALLPVIRIGGLEIDVLGQEVRWGRVRLRLTAIEQSLLYLLASNPGQTLSREAILDVIWGSDFIAESNLVDRHIRNLRVKLKDDWRRPRVIRTVPGEGYRFLLAA
jgi:two-component system alkaline phosphatase synthesis response regulator PhoP